MLTMHTSKKNSNYIATSGSVEYRNSMCIHAYFLLLADAPCPNSLASIKQIIVTIDQDYKSFLS